MLRNVFTVVLCTSLLGALATPAYPENAVQARDAAVDNIVYVTDANKFWCVQQSPCTSLFILNLSSFLLQHDHAPRSAYEYRRQRTSRVSRRRRSSFRHRTNPNTLSSGMKTYCSPAGRYSSQQGQLPADFWSNVEFKSGKGKNGGRYAQRKNTSHLTPRPFLY